MLFRVASFVRVGSGGKGAPRRELIFSIAAESESESKAASQALVIQAQKMFLIMPVIVGQFREASHTSLIGY
jgi:hypothetical protein